MRAGQRRCPTEKKVGPKNISPRSTVVSPPFRAVIGSTWLANESFRSDPQQWSDISLNRIISPRPTQREEAPATATLESARSAHGAVFARMARNIGWLLGGRGFSGVVGLVYLAFATRALGPHGFGTFSLILAYGSGIANLIQFRSWQAVIRFGSVHLAARCPDRLKRLL